MHLIFRSLQYPEYMTVHALTIQLFAASWVRVHVIYIYSATISGVHGQVFVVGEVGGCGGGGLFVCFLLAAIHE